MIKIFDMKYFFFILIFLHTISAFSQTNFEPLNKKIIVKTNVMNLLAKRPALTVEKVFSKRFSAEFSFVQGAVDDFLLTDHYEYMGILFRAKKYITDLDYGRLSPYAGLYIGNLKRSLQTDGTIFSIDYSRDFLANSIRTGGTLGWTYISNKKLVLDALVSLGYGKYIKYYKDRDSNGYVDCQFWLSIGYCLGGSKN